MTSGLFRSLHVHGHVVFMVAVIAACSLNRVFLMLLQTLMVMDDDFCSHCFVLFSLCFCMWSSWSWSCSLHGRPVLSAQKACCKHFFCNGLHTSALNPNHSKARNVLLTATNRYEAPERAPAIRDSLHN